MKQNWLCFENIIFYSLLYIGLKYYVTIKKQVSGMDGGINITPWQDSAASVKELTCD